MFWKRKLHPAEILASDLANTIQHQLTRLNLAYREKREGVQYVQQVEFAEPIIATPEEIKIEIDIQRLPRAVTITDLRDAKVLETLGAACKRPVRAEHKRGPGGGFWFVVELAERSSIPRLVRFHEMRQPDKAPALLIPIGVGEHKRARWEDLRKLPHLLVAGATGQGKSVAVNTILCHLARRWQPDTLKLWLVDLKGGMELSFYEDLPHVEHFATKAPQLPGLLFKLQTEMDRRTDLLKGKARDIDDYNAARPAAERLPYVVLVVDEIANAMLNKARGDWDGQKMSVAAASEMLLADLAARARATGIHMIISTQRPSVDVITGLIKANFPCRIAFGTSSEIDSRVIIDDGGAHGLKVGRMLFRRNMELLELQAPLINDADVKSIVAAVKRGEYQQEPVKTAEDAAREQIGYLLNLAEVELAGQFSIRKLAGLSRGIIGQTRIEELAERLENEKILKRQFGPRPRQIAMAKSQWQAKYPPSVLRHTS